MKKIFKIVLVIFIICLSVAGFVACGMSQTNNSDGDDSSQNNTNENVTEPKAVSAHINESTIPKNVYAGNLDLSVIKLIITYNDSTVKQIDLSEEMIAVSSRSNLDKVGTHNIEVIYSKGLKCYFQITLISKETITYTLTVDGGKPISVNGELVDVNVGLDGKFTETYANGTEVVIEWIDNGKDFQYWMMNGESTPVDTQKRTTVIMNENYEYIAKWGEFIYSVSFVPYNNTTIGSKTTEVINSQEEIAKEMVMDDYVFIGWTTDYIPDMSEACSGNEHNMVTFPYEVKEDTVFYGLWMKIGLLYTSYTSNSTGHTVNGYQVTGYNGGLKELSIPAEYKGLPVLSIAKDTFDLSDNATIKKTEEQIKNIKSLTRITIPASVIDIEEGTFRDCSSLQYFYVDAASKNYTSERGVLYRDDKSILVAYPSGRVQASYELELNTVKICEYAFYNAIVGSIDTGNTVINTIGNGAFNSIHIDNINFYGLKPEYLGIKDRDGNIVSYDIGNDVFSDNLNRITVNETYLQEYQKIFYNIKDKFSSETASPIYLYQYAENYSVLFKLINGEYFYRTDKTAEIIGVSRDIKEIDIPQTIKSGYNNYYLTSIGYYAFKDCIDLVSVKLPDSLERVCDLAFDDTPWQKSLEDDTISAHSVLFKYVGENSEYKIAGDITKVAEGAFQGNETLEYVDISLCLGLKSIEAFAFADCKSLTGMGLENSLLIKNSIKKIAAYAFKGTKFTNITSEQASSENKNTESATIEDYAFMNCYYLENIEFYDEYLTSISENALYKTYSLNNIAVSENNKVFKAYDGILYKVIDEINGELGLFHYPAGKMNTVFNPSKPGNIDNIKERVTSIGNYAMHDSNIGAILIETTITDIASNAINIPGLTYVKFNGEPSAQLTYVDFVNTGSEKFIFDNNDYAKRFFGYDAGELIDIENKYNIVIYDGILYSIYNNEFASVIGIDRSQTISEIVIPNTIEIDRVEYTVNKINKYSIYGYNIEKLTINNINKIESNALKAAYSLTNLKIDAKTEEEIPEISRDSLGDKFNNDLIIEINCDYDLYFDKWSDIEGCYLKLFDYTDIDGKIKYASRNLIYNTPFVVITYISEEGVEITENIYSGTLNEIQINNLITDLSTKKQGYVVGKWLDSEQNIWELNSEFNVPYNMILCCEWVAKVYNITFMLPNGVTFADSAVVSKYMENGNEIWKTTVTYDAEYDFSIVDSENYKYDFNGWKQEGSDELISLRGSRWDKVFDATDVVFVPERPLHNYIVEFDISDSNIEIDGKTISQLVTEKNITRIVNFGKSYVLPVPSKVGYKFKGWTIKENGFRITSENGYSLNEWNIVQSQSVIITPQWENLPITVVLMFDENDTDSVYDEVIVYLDRDDFDLSIDKTKVKDKYVDKVDNFAGWKNANGKIYTYSDGKASTVWDVYSDEKIFLYAIWPEEFDNAEDFKNAVIKNPEISALLTSDIVITEPFAVEYTGVFNGGGHKIIINYDKVAMLEDVDLYSGIFTVNRGTIKNAIIEININLILPNNFASNVFIGGICGINYGLIQDVNVEVKSFNLEMQTISTKCKIYAGSISGQNSGNISGLNLKINQFKISDENGNFGGDISSIGSIVGNNAIMIEDKIVSGNIIGQCSYRKQSVESEYIYYVDATEEAKEYNRKNNWSEYYTSFYYYKDMHMVDASAKFNSDIVYYKQTTSLNDYFNDVANIVGNEMKGNANVSFSSLK